MRLVNPGEMTPEQALAKLEKREAEQVEIDAVTREVISELRYWTNETRRLVRRSLRELR